MFMSCSVENTGSETVSIPTNLRLISDFPAAVNVVLQYLDLTENPDEEQPEDGNY